MTEQRPLFPIEALSSKIYENQEKMILYTVEAEMDEENERNKKITVQECRQLREITDIMTRGCMMTKGEFSQIMIIYYNALKRMEEEQNES